MVDGDLRDQIARLEVRYRAACGRLRAVPEGHAAFEGGYRRRRNLR